MSNIAMAIVVFVDQMPPHDFLFSAPQPLDGPCTHCRDIACREKSKKKKDDNRVCF